jgi:hypothetical protein
MKNEPEILTCDYNWKKANKQFSNYVYFIYYYVAKTYKYLNE